MGYPTSLIFYAKGTKFVITGTGKDPKTGEWKHDIKNIDENSDNYGKRALRLTYAKIMSGMTDQEKQEFKNKFL